MPASKVVSFVEYRPNRYCPLNNTLPVFSVAFFADEKRSLSNTVVIDRSQIATIIQLALFCHASWFDHSELQQYSK